MKLGPLFKFEKRAMITSKKLNNNFMSANYEIIIISLIYLHLGAIYRPGSKCMVDDS